mgnify:CR=1 FL=1
MPDKLPAPWVSLGDATASVVTRLRRQRLAAYLHGLGPRAVYHALTEVADGGDLDAVLAAYARLTRAQIGAAGGSGFPPEIFPAGE